MSWQHWRTFIKQARAHFSTLVSQPLNPVYSGWVARQGQSIWAESGQHKETGSTDQFCAPSRKHQQKVLGWLAVFQCVDESAFTDCNVKRRVKMNLGRCMSASIWAVTEFSIWGADWSDLRFVTAESGISCKSGEKNAATSAQRSQKYIYFVCSFPS